MFFLNILQATGSYFSSLSLPVSDLHSAVSPFSMFDNSPRKKRLDQNENIPIL